MLFNFLHSLKKKTYSHCPEVQKHECQWVNKVTSSVSVSVWCASVSTTTTCIAHLIYTSAHSYRTVIKAPTSKGGRVGDLRFGANMLCTKKKKAKKALQLLHKQPQSRSDFDPTHVNTALGLTSAALERACGALQKCLSTLRPLNRE